MFSFSEFQGLTSDTLKFNIIITKPVKNEVLFWWEKHCATIFFHNLENRALFCRLLFIAKFLFQSNLETTDWWEGGLTVQRFPVLQKHIADGTWSNLR